MPVKGSTFCRATDFIMDSNLDSIAPEFISRLIKFEIKEIPTNLLRSKGLGICH